MKLVQALQHHLHPSSLAFRLEPRDSGPFQPLYHHHAPTISLFASAFFLW